MFEYSNNSSIDNSLNNNSIEISMFNLFEGKFAKKERKESSSLYRVNRIISQKRGSCPRYTKDTINVTA